MGMHDDAPATARWHGGMRVVSSHANGTQVQTDMPTELGGTGDQVSPGWLFRAGFASCVATTIAMHAASEGIELKELELSARSRSDTRGLLGMSDTDGTPVSAGPRDVQLHVRIAADGVSADKLRSLVERSQAGSAMSVAIKDAVPIALVIEVASARSGGG